LQRYYDEVILKNLNKDNSPLDD